MNEKRVVAGKGQVAYGFSIGVLMLDCHIPFIPGDVGNASTYDFPVLYRLVPGATGDAVITRQDPSLAEVFATEARELVRQGARAITGDCGFMAIYQREVEQAVDVPVFLTSLLQIPLVLAMLSERKRLGVLVANGASVNERLLAPARVTPELRERCAFRGLQDKPHFRSVFLDEIGELDPVRCGTEVVEAARELQASEPDLGAILLECSDLPPYAAAVQEATGLPVFDWIGFIEYVHRAVVSRRYDGFH